MGNQRATGKEKEQMAAAYLEQLGYQIIERNFYCRQGEIDLICKDGLTYVFVEVKYRKSRTKGTAAEAVTREKCKRILSCARYYLYSHHIREDSVSCRFDVVAIDGEEITLIKNAFDADYR